MKKTYPWTLNKASLPWLGLFAASLVAIASLSFAYEVHRAKTSVTQYIAIWEEDLAKSLLMKKDSALLDKIIAQLKEVHSSVAQVDVTKNAVHECLISNEAPITLYSLPAGQVRVCYSLSDLGVKTVLSPIFLLGIFLGLAFVSFGSRRELLNQLQEQELRSELALNQEISEISRQVAHDIRGPLMALNTLSQLSHEMSEDKQQLFQMAVTRIKTIAEDLLSRSKNKKTVKANEPQASMVEICNGLIKELQLTHKSVQFTLQNNLKENFSSPIEKNKLQRIIFNIIHNSLEALPPENGLVGVSLFKKEEQIHLQIIDNGKGIPADILPKLTQEGVSFGKANGNGLGLYDAKKTLESIQGQLQIQSRVDIGTQVTLVFPASLAKSHTA
ncbi:Sporulation kinase A [compost metagenome]